jgi:hypothetical protein
MGETGVMGVTNSFGVVGRSLTGVIVDEQGVFVSGTGVVGRCDAGVGVHGVATSGWGIIGQSEGRAGVTGKSVSGIGVDARSEHSHAVQATTQDGIGVFGESVVNSGVLGHSRDAVGVEGVSDQGLAGVRGRSNRYYGLYGASTEGAGVYGTAPGNAIQGRSTGSAGNSIGVSGLSDAGAGVQGDSVTGIGVVGRSSRGWAAYFQGNVAVRGGFYVVGGSKSAAVRHPDGSDRALFCLESPESYFEDFGEAALTGASLVVKLDKDFAALVKRNNYQVFLTSYGPDAVYVRRRSADAFEIARVEDGSGRRARRLRVGYRIVARRADLRSARLPKIRISVEPAELQELEPKTTKSVRKRAGKPTSMPRVEAMPAAPTIPMPDLEALANVKPVDAKGERSS